MANDRGAQRYGFQQTVFISRLIDHGICRVRPLVLSKSKDPIKKKEVSKTTDDLDSAKRPEG